MKKTILWVLLLGVITSATASFNFPGQGQISDDSSTQQLSPQMQALIARGGSTVKSAVALIQSAQDTIATTIEKTPSIGAKIKDYLARIANAPAAALKSIKTAFSNFKDAYFGKSLKQLQDGIKTIRTNKNLSAIEKITMLESLYHAKRRNADFRILKDDFSSTISSIALLETSSIIEDATLSHQEKIRKLASILSTVKENPKDSSSFDDIRNNVESIVTNSMLLEQALDKDPTSKTVENLLIDLAKKIASAKKGPRYSYNYSAIADTDSAAKVLSSNADLLAKIVSSDITNLPESISSAHDLHEIIEPIETVTSFLRNTLVSPKKPTIDQMKIALTNKMNKITSSLVSNNEAVTKGSAKDMMEFVTDSSEAIRNFYASAGKGVKYGDLKKLAKTFLEKNRTYTVEDVNSLKDFMSQLQVDGVVPHIEIYTWYYSMYKNSIINSIDKLPAEPTAEQIAAIQEAINTNLESPSLRRYQTELQDSFNNALEKRCSKPNSLGTPDAPSRTTHSTHNGPVVVEHDKPNQTQDHESAVNQNQTQTHQQDSHGNGGTPAMQQVIDHEHEYDATTHEDPVTHEGEGDRHEGHGE